MVLPEVKCRSNRLAEFLTNLGRCLCIRVETIGTRTTVAGILSTQLKTLKIVKAEFAPGKAYEHDVPGLYAQVMLQALRAVAREALWRRHSEPTQKKVL
jgi:hypothetical protein